MDASGETQELLSDAIKKWQHDSGTLFNFATITRSIT
jgi:hypothetical protein